MREETIARFWAKVSRGDGCWLWTASKRNKGYGAFAYKENGRVVQDRAHRTSYVIHKGEVPAGMLVLHTCDTPACVNPAHLFVGTNADNVADMMSKGRHVAGGTYRAGNYEKGELHHAARLNESDVRAIRARINAGESMGSVSRAMGLSIGHVHRIYHRKAWGHVK